MTRAKTTILCDDPALRGDIERLLRSCGTPVTIADARDVRGDAAVGDILIIDGRQRPDIAISHVERVRASAPRVGIVFIAREAHPEAILQAMRAGANEFLTWPLSEEAFRKAIGTAARRGVTAGPRTHAAIVAFLGAKGGAGTTTVAVNCGVELASRKRPTVVLDLKPGLGDVALFLGVRSRYTIADALDNVHRLDAQFLSSLVAKHVSSVEILAGAEQFDRPAPADAEAIHHVIRLFEEDHQHVILDLGCQINACTLAALHRAELIGVVTNPDVPSIRHTQRVLDKIGELGAAERVRVLLNRSAEPHPIPLKQIEDAIGRPVDLTFPSDYRTVSTALNTGIPLTFSDDSTLADQFKRLTELIVEPSVSVKPAGKRRPPLDLKFASLW